MCTWRRLVVQPPFSHRPLPTGEGRVFADIGDLSCKCKVAFQTVVHTNLSITCVFSTCKFSLLKKSASQCAKGRDGSRENVLCGLSSTHARQALHTWQGWISLTEEQTENQKYPSSKKYPAVWNSFWERLAYFFKVQKKVTKIDFLLRLLFIQMIAILFLEQHVGVTTQRFLERQIEVLALGFCWKWALLSSLLIRR